MSYEVVQHQIGQLIHRHGSLRAAARVLQISAPYLSRLFSGEKKDASDAILRKLGVRRVVTFERIRS